MKILVLCIAIGVGLLTSSSPASATESARNDGNELLTCCSGVIDYPTEFSPARSFGTGFCIGMVAGVRNMMLLTHALLKPPAYCFPERGFTNGQAARIVVKWLEDNPNSLHKDAAFVTMLAFMDAFPCLK